MQLHIPDSGVAQQDRFGCFSELMQNRTEVTDNRSVRVADSICSVTQITRLLDDFGAITAGRKDPKAT